MVGAGAGAGAAGAGGAGARAGGGGGAVSVATGEGVGGGVAGGGVTELGAATARCSHAPAQNAAKATCAKTAKGERRTARGWLRIPRSATVSGSNRAVLDPARVDA